MIIKTPWPEGARGLYYQDRIMANIVLTGFMATGKSTVGRALAKALGLSFVDMDSLIEKEAGLSVADIFKEYGEPFFRAAEVSVVRRLANGEYGTGLVVSTGGGVVADPANRAALKGWATVICLSASVDEILRRVGARADRPLLDVADRRERVERLLAERAEAYIDCHLVIDTTGKSVDEIAGKIIAYLREGAR